MTLLPTFSRDGIDVHHARCEDLMAAMPDASVDLIVTDPPYFRVKSDWWDRQWDRPEKFLAWIGELCDQWRRVLKPNGSLYVFSSPQMAWGVEGEVRKRFEVLNNIRWVKDAGWHKKTDEEILRRYLNPWESIIFAEHFGSDGIARGEASYDAKCEELRGFVFEPLLAYIAGEFERAGMLNVEGKIAANVACGFSPSAGGMASRHYFSQSQWQLPTKEHYEALRKLLNQSGGDYLRREYEDLRREYEDLRREYEDLRREYEDLRRPFYASASRPYTDVWDFPTVQDYPGKHPCEKPLKMMEHIVETSSRPGAVVLDCFAGSGVVGQACRNFERKAILCEVEERWVNRIINELRQGALFAAAG